MNNEYATNLVSTWRDIVTRGGAEQLAPNLRLMNEALGTKFRNDKINDWQKGTKSPSKNVINYMIDIVLTSELTSKGLTPEETKDLIEKIKVL